MAVDWIPVDYETELREKLYHYLLEDEVVVFSKPSPNEDKPVETLTDSTDSAYFITRDGRSALNIAAVSKKVRSDSLPFLAALLKFDLGDKATVLWFRERFPKDFRKSVEKVVIRCTAIPQFSNPVAHISWASLKTLTISEVINGKSLRLKKKDFRTTIDATAWVKNNWAVVRDVNTYSPDEAVTHATSSPAISALLNLPKRSFDVFAAVYINETTDAVAKLTKSSGAVVVESVEFVSPGLPRERRVDMRREYFEIKQKGAENLPELLTTKCYVWAKPAGHKLG